MTFSADMPHMTTFVAILIKKLLHNWNRLIHQNVFNSLRSVKSADDPEQFLTAGPTVSDEMSKDSLI